MTVIRIKSLVATALFLFSGAAITAGEKISSPSELAADLKSKEAQTRRDAALFLSRMGAEAREVVPQLIEALTDPEQQVWFGAVVALSNIGPDAAEAIPALIDGLSDRTRGGWRQRYWRQVWYRSAYALGQIGPAAIPALRETLEHEEAPLRAGAAKALGWMGEAASETVPLLAAKLADEDEDVRLQAAEALGEIRQAGLSALVAALSHKNPAARSSAAYGLKVAFPSNEQARQALAQVAADDEQSRVRAAALETLTALGYRTEPFLPLLLKALLDPDEGVQHEAINGLLSLEPSVTVPPLINMVREPNQEHQERAAFVLFRIGPPAKESARPLIKVLLEGANRDQQVFIRALRAVGAPAIPEIMSAIQDQPASNITLEHWSVQSLSGMGGASVEPLAEFLENPSETVRLAAARSLQLMEGESAPARQNLLGCLEDPSELVRAASLQALVNSGAGFHLLEQPLRRALNDASKQVRRSAVDAIADLNKEAKSLVPELVLLVSDEDGQLRTAAIAALGSMEEEAHPAAESLVQALDSAPPSEQEEIVRTLGRIGSSAALAVPSLSELLEREPGLRISILTALANIGPEAEPALPRIKASLEHPEAEIRAAAVVAFSRVESNSTSLLNRLRAALEDERTIVRQPAAQGLGRLGQDASEAAPRLFDLLKSREDRGPALEALRLIGPHPASELIQAISNEDPGVRAFACEFLGRLGAEAHEAIPLLRTRVRDNYDMVRQQARGALRRIEQGLFDQLNDSGQTSAALEALRILEPRSVKSLIEALSHDQPEVRLFALEALDRLGSDASNAVPALRERLSDSDMAVREQARLVLARFDQN
jgi:HEAT repeat protein